MQAFYIKIYDIFSVRNIQTVYYLLYILQECKFAQYVQMSTRTQLKTIRTNDGRLRIR